MTKFGVHILALAFYRYEVLLPNSGENVAGQPFNAPSKFTQPVELMASEPRELGDPIQRTMETLEQPCLGFS